jgi:hypothetical protein
MNHINTNVIDNLLMGNVIDGLAVAKLRETSCLHDA